MDPTLGYQLQAGKPVLQARSADTLDRILNATEELLVDREFDQITIAEIASHAGCAVGTVYGRVTNKERLLFCLHDRYMTNATQEAINIFSTLGSARLIERVSALCDLMVDLLHDNLGVVRAVTNHLYTSSSKAASESISGLKNDATTMFRSTAAFLAEPLPNATDPQTLIDCEFALLAAHDVIQSRIIFGTRSGLELDYSPDDLKARTTDLMMRYLTPHTNP